MLTRALSLVHIDFAPQHRQPNGLRVLVASVTAIAGSLAADALCVVIGRAMFPSTKGYVHFQFQDYAKLVAIAVVTYYSLVGIAPVGQRQPGRDRARPAMSQPGRHASHRA